MSNPSPMSGGLQWIAHMLKAPDVNREAFLASEIHHRERDRVLYGVSRQLVRGQIGTTVRLVLITALTVFALTWTVGQVGQLIDWFKNTWTHVFTLPPTLRGLAPIDLTRMFPSPTSTIFLASDVLPTWSTHDASIIAFVVTFIVLLWRINATYRTWQQDQVLKIAIAEIDEELALLRQWQYSVAKK